jgi:diguanylate cyclase (GGDEF)-like protein
VHGPELAAELYVLGWELGDPLGDSSRSVVYRAEREGSAYAVKVMRDPQGGAGVPDRMAVLAEFRREAALVAAVAHPGLPRVYEVGQAGGWPYLAMELLTGRSLAVTLTGGPLPVADAVRLAVTVAGTLVAVHQAGMVHRGVNPDNIVFDRAGQPRLIAFGQAGIAAALEGTPGGDGGAAGALRYGSPEQTGGLARPVDHRCDLYSLGAVLYECLAGTPPVTATGAGSPPPPLPDTVPAALAAIVAVLLATDPDDRYRGAEGLVADLRRVLDGDTDFPPRTADELLLARGDRQLVGVGAELAVLAGCWRQAVGGAGQVLLVRGGGGSGKSRMLRELARGAHRQGHPVLLGQCLPGAPVPFGPLRQALEGYLRELDEAGLSRVRAAAGQNAALLAPLSPTLARLLGVDPALTDRDSPVEAAVAAFLAELARRAGGLLLCLDDVHWLGESTGRVLRRLAEEAPLAPLLVACAGRDAELDQFWQITGSLDIDLELPVLPDDAVAALLAVEFGGPAEPGLVTRLAAFTRNNPYGLVTTARTLVAGGLVRPHWGRALVNDDAFDAVDLPTDVRSMLDAQLDLLGPGLAVLTSAATIGDRFGLDTLLALHGGDPGAVVRPLGMALDHRLVEQTGPEEYRFVHHGTRRLLLARLDADARRRLHQRIAEVLDAGKPANGPEHGYDLARHYTAGEVAANPARVYEVCWAAGRAALADHAAAEAAAYLDSAAGAARLAGIEPPSAFEATVGLARYAAGELDEAATWLDRALAGESDWRRRVELLDQLARVEYARPDFAAMAGRSAQALAELGQPAPHGWSRAYGAALWALLRASWYLLPGLFGTSRGSVRERQLAQLRIAETCGRASYQMMPTRVHVALALRGLAAANRVGPSPEYVLGYVTMTMATLAVGWRRFGRWAAGRAERAARQLGDPRLIARVGVCRAYLRTAGRDDIGGARLMQRVVVEQGRWLPTELYLEAATAAAAQLDSRGYSREADELRLRAVDRGLALPTSLSTSVVIGDTTEPDQQVALAEHLLSLDSRPWRAVGPLAWGALMGCAAFALRERGDTGPAGDRFLDAMLAHGPTVANVRPYSRPLFLTLAYIRLEQAALADHVAHPAALERARRAVRDFGRLAGHSPPLTAHHRVLQGSLAFLEGRPRAALRRLDRADRLAEKADAPRVRYESSLVRARALVELGSPSAGVASALALLLAERHGWVHRAARVRREFGTGTGISYATAASTHGRGAALRDRRYLDGLLQVSVAAASVLEPRELARVALDELLKIFGAERAYLFASPAEDAPLERYAGRDANGHDLADLVGYGTTLVERARAERRAFVVTGTEQGGAAGTQGAVTYGLRSIMVAPLRFGQRLLGVVYLDSRATSGIFGADDQEVLVAVANQVATALETARAAQREIQAQTGRRQRELADQLREAAAQLSRTLDPDEVLDRALELAAAMVGADAGCVLVLDEVETRVAAVQGRAAAVADRASGEDLTRGSAVLLPAVLSAAGVEVGDDLVIGRQAGQLPVSLHVLLGRPRGWLAIPLTARGARFGLLILASRELHGGPEESPGIAAAFAAQAATAYDNARLFRQVERLARTDGLTSLDNRRYFMELATRELAAASRRGTDPMAAIMLDIDHFKQVNDKYGHAAGDEVIRIVGYRLRGTLRSGDLLCRYGGEEFAVLARGAEEELLRLAERLRLVVAAKPVLTHEGGLAVTVSVGLAMRWMGESALEPMLARADAALYRAKQLGRNRVATADATPAA